MKFNKKIKATIYLSIITASTYIGTLLGRTFCVVENQENCISDILMYSAVINSIGILGIYTLTNLAEKSITEWNQTSEEE